MKTAIMSFCQRHRRWFYGAGLLVCSLGVAFLMNVSWGGLPEDVAVGRIARQDIRADKDYEIIDEEATAKLKREAAEAVLPIFDWNAALGREKIVGSREELDPWREKGIFIRQVQDPDQPLILFKDLTSILSLSEARARISRPARRGHLQPTLFYNEAETRAQEERSLAEVKPVIIKVQAGESILRSGDHFEPRHLKIINGIRREKMQLFGRTRFLGTFLFVGLFLLVVFSVLEKNVRKVRVAGKDLLFLGLLLLLLIALERAFLFVGDAVRGLLPVEVPLSSLYALMPVAAGAMMVRMVLPLPLAILFAPVAAAIAGLLLQGSLFYTLYYLVGSVLGIQLSANLRGRGPLFRAGVMLGVLNALALLALDMINMTSVSGAVDLRDSFLRIVMAFLGGPASAVTVMILMPLFEAAFNYLTPIKLLEFGSLNHPLLREMIVRAPGTYHHSHMVGTLAEAACEAIGADSLFARVASYFHDIGKMKKSPYFIENEMHGEDRHARLSPSMSALIIASHVREGVELAKEHKLPLKIREIIPQHQGTKLISYFYSKAKEVEDQGVQVVDEKEYRYPGPKPQSREAGVILLADTAEAATRSLTDRSPARLEEVVRNVINKNFIDGQLDECELTLADLHLIAKSFVRILMGIYHQRIEYPEELEPSGERGRSVSERYADKYLQSKPLGEDFLQETPAAPSPHLRRIGPEGSS